MAKLHQITLYDFSGIMHAQPSTFRKRVSFVPSKILQFLLHQSECRHFLGSIMCYQGMAVDCGRTTHRTASFLGLVFAKLGWLVRKQQPKHLSIFFFEVGGQPKVWFKNPSHISVPLKPLLRSPHSHLLQRPSLAVSIFGTFNYIQLQKVCLNMEKWNPNSLTFILVGQV